MPHSQPYVYSDCLKREIALLNALSVDPLVALTVAEKAALVTAAATLQSLLAERPLI